ncbi:MAG TPA: response regulator, partial [Coleofasciculaceae cyanobacterium]
MPKPVTLLLVDDTATDRAIYQRFLHQDHRRRYEIVELGTGEAALNWCQQHAPDLILLDYSLPGINGLEFLKRLKQQQAELPPVILLTGYGNTHIAVEAMKQGAQDYLDKNQLKADILCLTVHSVLERVQFHRCLKRQQEQQQLVTEIALRIRQSLDLEDILNTAVQEVRLFLQTDRVIIYRFDSGWQGQVMVEAIGAGWTPMLGEVIYDPCFELDCVNHYRQGRVSTIDNVLTASLEPCYEDLLTRFQVQSNLVVPILQGEDLWGLLIAQHCVSPRLWQTDEIEMLQQLAVQLSIAIHQAELHQQVQHELQERRQAEVQQQQSQARFRAMFEQSPLGIVHFDPQGQLLAVNRAWAKIWDTTTEHLQNYNVLQELSLEQDGNLSAIQRAFVGEPVFLPT